MKTWFMISSNSDISKIPAIYWIFLISTSLCAELDIYVYTHNTEPNQTHGSSRALVIAINEASDTNCYQFFPGYSGFDCILGRDIPKFRKSGSRTHSKKWTYINKYCDDLNEIYLNYVLTGGSTWSVRTFFYVETLLNGPVWKKIRSQKEKRNSLKLYSENEIESNNTYIFLLFNAFVYVSFAAARFRANSVTFIWGLYVNWDRCINF